MTPLESILLYVATPTVFVCALLEALVLQRRSPYNWRAFGMSSFDLFARVAFGLVVRWSIATPVLIWAIRHRLGVIHLDGVAAVAALFVGQEFCYYWYHRAAHRVRWFWCVHCVHHSPNELNLSAAFRIGIFGKLTGLSFFFAPLVWLGFDVRTVFSVLTLNLLYQFWIHATWIPKLGWLEGIFNTPSSHRVHHAANVEYLDANYGGVLVVFDRLFGTYRPERDDLPCRYGLVQPMTSHNPLVVEGAPWWWLLRDLGAALRGPTPGGRVRAVLGLIFMPPGWVPDGPGQTTEDLRARAATVSAV